jgi:NDP-sugar pyrophosphorylase family protein
MKTILICPNQANGLPVLADSRPLATLPILGEAFLGYWLQHLAAEKHQEVRIITSDPTEAITEYTQDGSRWGLRLEVSREVRELSAEEIVKRYVQNDGGTGESEIIHADHLPGLPDGRLFNSYRNWFEILPLWLPFVARGHRIGVREISPGVWVGRRAKIARGVKLTGPCWIGEQAQIGKDATIGPNGFLENQVVVDQGGTVQNSWVGPETFLGSLTELRESLAWGNLLINWKSGSHTYVPDPFLLTSLSDDKERSEGRGAVSADAVASPLAQRIETVISLARKLQS